MELRKMAKEVDITYSLSLKTLTSVEECPQ